MKNNKNINKNSKAFPFKRILGLLILIAVLTIGMFFSSKYITNNSRLGSEYGGGIRVTIKIVNNNDTRTNNDNIQIAENSIYDRTKILGLETPSIYIKKSSTEDNFVITQPGIFNDTDAEKFVSQITYKSRLSLYTIDDIPVFTSNGYNSAKKPEDETNNSIKNQLDIVKPGSAKPAQRRNGGSRLYNTVEFQFKDTSSKIAYQTALSEIAKGDEKKGQNQMVMWVNRLGLENLAKTRYQDDWNQAGKNLFNFCHVYVKDKDGKSHMTSQLKTTPFNANNYLISVAPVNTKISGNSVFIPNTFKPDVARSIAAQINYGSASYKLEKNGDYSFTNPPSNNTAIKRLIIAGIVIMILMILFLIWRYGLLGLISAVAFILFSIITLTLFTAVKGEITSLTVSSLILGIGLMLDNSILTFEAFRKKIQEGKSAKRSIKFANRILNSTIFDTSFIVLVSAFIIFYIGTQSLPSFSVIIIISIFVSLFMLFFFVKLFATILINLKIVDKHKWLVGLYHKNSKPLIKEESYNYVKSAKWGIISYVGIFFAALITFSIFVGISGSITRGLNSNTDITGGTEVSISRTDIDSKKPSGSKYFTSDDVSKINGILDKNEFKSNILNIQQIYQDSNKTKINEIDVFFAKSYNPDLLITQLQGIQLYDNLSKIKILNSKFVNKFSQSLMKKAVIALIVTLVVIAIYTLARFKWTFSLSLLISLIFDGLMLGAVFILTRFTFSPLFSAGMLSVLLYSMFNKIQIFEIIGNYMKNKKIASLTEISKIVNDALHKTFYRNIFMFILMLSIGIILIAIPLAVDRTFAIAFFFGIISSLISTLFIFPYFWVKFATLRHKVISKNRKKKILEISGPEEQTFPNINDIKGI